MAEEEAFCEAVAAICAKRWPEYRWAAYVHNAYGEDNQVVCLMGNDPQAGPRRHGIGVRRFEAGTLKIRRSASDIADEAGAIVVAKLKSRAG